MSAATDRYEKFIEHVAKSGTVWVLDQQGEVATTVSEQLEDTKGRPVDVVCFWSNKLLAKVCGRQNWPDHRPQELSLAEFLEDWCAGLHNDNLLAGINFDLDLVGHEADPLGLVVALVDRLRAENKEVALEQFKSLEEMQTQARNIIKRY